jgi:hypothetical protein
MLGHEEKLRHFLLRRIGPLTNDKLRRYEEISGKQCERVQQWEILEYETGYEEAWFGSCPKDRKPEDYYAECKAKAKERLSKHINKGEACCAKVIANEDRKYAAFYELWLARRRMALTSGNFFQLSWRPSKLWRFVCAWLYYRKVQLRTPWKRLMIWLSGHSTPESATLERR